MNIPTSTVWGFMGVLVFGLGLFLLLGSANIIQSKTVSVSPGKKTAIIGVIFVLLGGSLLLTELKSVATLMPRFLTKKNGAEFFDDFNNTSIQPNWLSVSGKWKNENGLFTPSKIIHDGEYIAYIQNKQWKNVVVTFDVILGTCFYPGEWHKYNDGKLFARECRIFEGWCDIEVCARMPNPDNGICYRIGGSTGGIQGNFRVGENRIWTDLEFHKIILNNKDEDAILHVSLEVKDYLFTAFVNGQQQAQYYDTTYSSGSVSFKQHYFTQNGNSMKQTFFDNIKVVPLN